MRSGLVLIAMVVFTALGGHSVEGQTSADSVAVVETMLEYWLAPENGSHYLGAAPYEPYHPRGEVGSFCVVIADGIGGTSEPLRSSELLTVVQEEISVAFELRHIEECTRGRDDEGTNQGFLDSGGVPAVQVRVGASFESPSEGRAYFGLSAGIWPGFKGWNCSVRRDDANGWHLVLDQCSYYES